MQNKALTPEMRDKIARLLEIGMGAKEISNFLGVSDVAVYTQKKVEELIKEDKLAEASEYVKDKNKSALNWALNKYGKTMPKKDNTEIKESNKADISKEENKVIDKDQMARIMYALGKMTEQMEIFNTKMDTLINAINANADNSYRLLCDTKGAMVEGLRKARKM